MPDLRSGLNRTLPGHGLQGWVLRTVRELKADDALAPVTLIVPNYYSGRQLRWMLAQAGGYANVRTILLGDLATQLLIGTAAAQRPLTMVLEESAVRQAVRSVGGVLRPLAHHRALHQALMQLFREVRRGESVLQVSGSEMARAAAEAYGVFEKLIAPFTDRTRLRELAALRVASATETPRELHELGGIVVCQLPRLDPADARLLAALARWTPVHANFVGFDDGDDLADTLPAEGSRLLTAALQAQGIAVRTEPIASGMSSAHLVVIRAPDPAEEIRELVRSVARELEVDPPVPLHRVAILYRQADPYGPLVRESLTRL